MDPPGLWYKPVERKGNHPMRGTRSDWELAAWRNKLQRLRDRLRRNPDIDHDEAAAIAAEFDVTMTNLNQIKSRLRRSLCGKTSKKK